MIDAMLHPKIYKKLESLIKNNKAPCCPICHKYIGILDADKVDYSKTSRGSEIFAHTKCIREAWK